MASRKSNNKTSTPTVLSGGRRPCQGGCGFTPYRRPSIPDHAVFCLECDPDGSRRDAAMTPEERRKAKRKVRYPRAA